METASITARSTLDSAVSATVTDTVTVGSPEVGVVLIPDHAVTAEPNSLVVLTHTLTNTGDMDRYICGHVRVRTGLDDGGTTVG